MASAAENVTLKQDTMLDSAPNTKTSRVNIAELRAKQKAYYDSLKEQAVAAKTAVVQIPTKDETNAAETTVTNDKEASKPESENSSDSDCDGDDKENADETDKIKLEQLELSENPFDLLTDEDDAKSTTVSKISSFISSVPGYVKMAKGFGLPINIRNKLVQDCCRLVIFAITIGCQFMFAPMLLIWIILNGIVNFGGFTTVTSTSLLIVLHYVVLFITFYKSLETWKSSLQSQKKEEAEPSAQPFDLETWKVPLFDKPIPYIGKAVIPNLGAKASIPKRIPYILYLMTLNLLLIRSSVLYNGGELQYGWFWFLQLLSICMLHYTPESFYCYWVCYSTCITISYVFGFSVPCSIVILSMLFWRQYQDQDPKTRNLRANVNVCVRLWKKQSKKEEIVGHELLFPLLFNTFGYLYTFTWSNAYWENAGTTFNLLLTLSIVWTIVWSGMIFFRVDMDTHLHSETKLRLFLLIVTFILCLQHPFWLFVHAILGVIFVFRPIASEVRAYFQKTKPKTS
jgi:hypothetical protein